MKKQQLLSIFGIIALVAVIGFSFASCDDGSSSGSKDGIKRIEVKSNGGVGSASYGITMELDHAHNQELADYSATGFTVKVNNTPVTVNSAYCYASDPKIYINFGAGGPIYTQSAVVTVSYDGTGPFAGILQKFSDKKAKWSD